MKRQEPSTVPGLPLGAVGGGALGSCGICRLSHTHENLFVTDQSRLCCFVEGVCVSFVDAEALYSRGT